VIQSADPRSPKTKKFMITSTTECADPFQSALMTLNNKNHKNSHGKWPANKLKENQKFGIIF